MGWRPYTEADREQVEVLHLRMESRLGTKLDLPKLDARPVLISLVYEKDGVITNGVFLEAGAEVCAIGETPLPAKEWESAAKTLTEVCRVYDLRIVRAFVPTQALAIKDTYPAKESPVGRMLRHFGFVREGATIAPFSRWI